MPKRLLQILALLEKHAGAAPRPTLTDPFALFVFESVAYLASDERRAAAFAELQRRVGIEPARILSADDAVLLAVTTLGGIHALERAERLRQIARITLTEADGDLAGTLRRLSTKKATKLLRRYPSIGEPGAEKILLFGGYATLPALDSNGLRALARFWFGAEDVNYATTYKRVRRAVLDGPSVDAPALVRIHQALRRHGQTICRRNEPLCAVCPLRGDCAFYASSTSTRGSFSKKTRMSSIS